MTLIYGRDGKIKFGDATGHMKGWAVEFESTKGSRIMDVFDEILRNFFVRHADELFGPPTRYTDSSTFTVRAALQYFGFTELPSEEALRTTFRGIAIATHPDTAGTEYYTEEFQRAKAHYDTLLNHIKRRRQ